MKTFNCAALATLALISQAAAAAPPKRQPVTHPPFLTAKGTVFMRCPNPRAIDGDTIFCSTGYRVRLLGIQAPELKCKAGMDCIAGDALASKASLAAALAKSKRITYQYIRRDNRSRPVVIVRAGKINVNCWQLVKGGAVLKWDYKGVIAAECGVKAL